MVFEDVLIIEQLGFIVSVRRELSKFVERS